MTHRTPFAALHHRDTPLLLPNAWDHASAVALARAGFPAVATTSLGVAASAGVRDGAGQTRRATLELVGKLGGHEEFLLSVDAEDGYSDDPEQVAAFAAQLVAAGVAGVNLEDGRADGTLTDPGLHAAKIAAVKASVPELFVNARTDTYWLGVQQDQTLRRLGRYHAAGADGVFVPGVAQAAQITEIVEAIDAPFNALYRPGGRSVPELAELGVRRISLGSLLYRTALGAALDALDAIRQGETAGLDAPAYGEVQALVT